MTSKWTKKRLINKSLSKMYCTESTGENCVNNLTDVSDVSLSSLETSFSNMSLSDSNYEIASKTSNNPPVFQTDQHDAVISSANGIIEEIHSSSSNLSDLNLDNISDLRKKNANSTENNHSPPEMNAVMELSTWATNYNVSHNSFKSLLKRINKYYDETMPIDPRTILKTPINKHEIKVIGGGSYFHFGIHNCAMQYYDKLSKLFNFQIKSHDYLGMIINIDGLPITKSAKHNVWPILVKFIREAPSHGENIDGGDIYQSDDIFVIGIFHGDSKPLSVTEYMKDFIDEFQNIIESGGLKINGNRVCIHIKYLTCDAPARQFLKCIKSHNAYYGCERCTDKGKYYKSVVFPDVNGELRTDESFRNKSNSDHHYTTSPLEILNIGMVSMFVLDHMQVGFAKYADNCTRAWVEAGKRRPKLGVLTDCERAFLLQKESGFG